MIFFIMKNRRRKNGKIGKRKQNERLFFLLLITDNKIIPEMQCILFTIDIFYTN